MSIQSNELNWLGIDFDGVLCYSEAPDYEPTYPLKGAREAMQKLHDEGWKLTIFTARPWADYQRIENWLIENQIPFRRIICGKPLLYRMVDDRNIEFRGDWAEVLTKIDKTTNEK